jgi:hypothetical protein
MHLTGSTPESRCIDYEEDYTLMLHLDLYAHEVGRQLRSRGCFSLERRVFGKPVN